MSEDAAESRRQPQRFSMIRTFVAADFITLGNGFCGAGSILALMQYMATGERLVLWAAHALLPIALVLDFADGRVARNRHQSSPLGADLDSLADVISFGMAPAALGFAVGLRGGLDVAGLLYFVACGISRLARFNVTASSLPYGLARGVEKLLPWCKPRQLATLSRAASARLPGAGDEIRTHDPYLGKVMLYP